MTTKTAGRPTSLRRSRLDRATAMKLASTEYGRYLDLLRSLTPPEWELSTDCPGWDVRAMATHNLGMAEMAASVRENLRQNWAAMRQKGVFVDALTALQVRERANLTPSEIVDRYAAVAPRAAQRRRRTPGFVLRAPMLVAQRVGEVTERWTLGYLVDTILTRDT